MSKTTIRLKADGRYCQIETDNHKLENGEEVLVESKTGTEVAYVISDKIAEENAGNEHDKSVEENYEYQYIRTLSDKDREHIDKLANEAKVYMIDCQAKIEKYKLPMQLLDAGLSFDEKKLTFYFTAPSRVDFRMLVSDLAHTFKKIIRLQQVGARDEARYLGGLGRCGEGLCCKRFLKGNLESVTLDMAVDQNLAQMGSNRVTGACGKLMCCLKYELDNYKEAYKKLPNLGETVKTKEGEGEVVSRSVVKMKFTVKLKKNDNLLEVSC